MSDLISFGIETAGQAVFAVELIILFGGRCLLRTQKTFILDILIVVRMVCPFTEASCMPDRRAPQLGPARFASEAILASFPASKTPRIHSPAATTALAFGTKPEIN
jgi:hypothetical protein